MLQQQSRSRLSFFKLWYNDHIYLTVIIKCFILFLKTSTKINNKPLMKVKLSLTYIQNSLYLYSLTLKQNPLKTGKIIFLLKYCLNLIAKTTFFTLCWHTIFFNFLINLFAKTQFLSSKTLWHFKNFGCFIC